MPALLADIAAPPAGGQELSVLSKKLDGLSAQVDGLRTAVRAELTKRSESASDYRNLLAAVETKVREAVEQTRKLSATPAPVTTPAATSPTRDDNLASDIVEIVTGWRRERHGGCPLDELYPRLAARHPSLTPGRFHDALRDLHQSGAITLTGWAKSLFELPRPELALFISDKVMYYANPADRSA